MAKSIAETVDFANAVEKRAYEKKAAQVDTFVQSESAEQKLARSGKMQTAKAIEGLASLGQTSLDLKASANKARVEELQNQIVEVTTNAIAEGENAGVHWSKTQTYLDMPELIKMDIAQRAGDRNSTTKQNKFNAALAADSTIIEDEVRYGELINEIFSPFDNRDIDDPYTAMSVSRENERDRVFLDEQRVGHNKAMDAKLVKERTSDFTMVVNDHIDSYNKEYYDTHPKDFVKAVLTDMVLNESKWMKTSGLKPSQMNATIQDALVKYAQDHDMPELLNNDYIPKQYRSGEFDSFAEKERQSLITKAGDAAIRKAQLDKLERDEHELAMEDDAYQLHLQGFIDLDDPENVAKGKVFLKKAKEYNDLFTSSSYNFGKVGNLQILRSNIMRSLADGSPLRDAKGNEVPMENMTLQSLIEYVRKTPHLTPDMKQKLIPDLANVMTMNTLDKSIPMEEGKGYIKDYIKDNFVDDSGMRATNLYREIVKKNWQVAQYDGSVNNPDYDINYDNAALFKVLGDSISEWENHYIVTGAKNPNASESVGTTNALGAMSAERNEAKKEQSVNARKTKSTGTAKPLPDAYLADYWRRYEIDPEAANKIITDLGYAIPTKK